MDLMKDTVYMTGYLANVDILISLHTQWTEKLSPPLQDALKATVCCVVPTVILLLRLISMA